MKALSEQDVRGSFVNCSKGESRRLNLPRGFAALPWDDLDFLGWADHSAPERRYLVAPRDGALVGVALRASAQRRGSFRRSMCSVCHTTHPADGVALLTARRPGAAGREMNSVGTYMCADLACSLYVRGKKIPDSGPRLKERLTLDEQNARTMANLYGFLDQLGVVVRAS